MVVDGPWSDQVMSDVAPPVAEKFLTHHKREQSLAKT